MHRALRLLLHAIAVAAACFGLVAILVAGLIYVDHARWARPSLAFSAGALLVGYAALLSGVGMLAAPRFGRLSPLVAAGVALNAQGLLLAPVVLELRAFARLHPDGAARAGFGAASAAAVDLALGAILVGVGLLVGVLEWRRRSRRAPSRSDDEATAPGGAAGSRGSAHDR